MSDTVVANTQADLTGKTLTFTSGTPTPGRLAKFSAADAITTALAGANAVLIGAGSAGVGLPYDEIILGAGFIMSGNVLTAVGIGGNAVVVAAADKSIASNVTLANDGEIGFPVLANATYQFDCVLFLSSGATNVPGFKFQWQFPSGNFSTSVTGLYSGANSNIFMGALLDEASPSTTLSVVVLDSGNGKTLLTMSGVVRNGVTPGAFNLFWSQNSSNATATTRHKDSYIKYTRVL